MFALQIKNDILGVCSKIYRILLMPVLNKVSLTCVSSPDTAALLKPIKDLPRRLYKVDIDVKDLQGNGDIQTVSVRICQCINGVCMATDRLASMGSLAWLAMLLPLLLLLLLCEFHAAGPDKNPPRWV